MAKNEETYDNDYVNPVTGKPGRHQKSGTCCDIYDYRCCNIGPKPDLDLCGHSDHVKVEETAVVAAAVVAVVDVAVAAVADVAVADVQQ